MKIAFLWEGVSIYGETRFRDGLWLALQRLRERHDIRYFEPLDITGIDEWKPDVLLSWAALSENSKPQVASYPYKKAICFAGGPIRHDNVDGFDLYFTESRINESEFKFFNKPFIRAFGVNEKIFYPEQKEKLYDASFAGTFALWKRPELFAHAVKDKGAWFGLFQDHEMECVEVCRDNGVTIRNETTRDDVRDLYNSSHTVLNTANFWGGGQRMTLEAMACNIPVIVMTDSIKNREYVEESGFGLVCEPDEQAIREAIEGLKGKGPINSRSYIEGKWTSKEYAENLEKGLLQL